MYDKIKLRKNQINAIQKSIHNNFKNGIHYHATGSGKSWIGIILLYEFFMKYDKTIKDMKILWICEKKIF